VWLLQVEGKVSTIDDSQQFQQVRKAMTVIELTDQEQNDIFAIVASVLHMGNVGFTEEDGKAKVLKPECVEAISKVTQKFALQVCVGNYVTGKGLRARGKMKGVLIYSLAVLHWILTSLHIQKQGKVIGKQHFS
jgi:Myosin heavy chain